MTGVRLESLTYIVRTLAQINAKIAIARSIGPRSPQADRNFAHFATTVPVGQAFQPDVFVPENDRRQAGKPDLLRKDARPDKRQDRSGPVN